jgi:ribosomal protein L20
VLIRIIRFGIPYGRFINGLSLSNILLNRKMLSELAIYEPYSFMAVVNMVKSKLPAPKNNTNAVTGNNSTVVG